MIKPIISEKSIKEAAENNIYLFRSTACENKRNVKKMVEELFKVNVVDVKSIKCLSDRRVNFKFRKYVPGKRSKKFYVKLKEGQSIEIYKQK